jgi:ABC-type transport system involved in multi-copper enzyme maturation permease subunit
VTELFNANFVAHLIYFRRSRLLLGFALVFLLMISLSVIPSLFIASGVQKFNILAEIVSSLHGFTQIFAAALALMVVSSHLRNRSLKMVFTKPCTPALWLVSAFAAAIAVIAVISIAIFACSIGLSFCWHLPVKAGLLFGALDNLIASIGTLVYVALMAMLLHPAIAVIVVLIFNASTFYAAQFQMLALMRTGSSSTTLRVLERVFHYLYLIAPIFHPFADKTSTAVSSMRVAHGDWRYLAYSLGYVLVLSAFCYCVALFALQKKRHI